jgi:hypothetical protein
MRNGADCLKLDRASRVQASHCEGRQADEPMVDGIARLAEEVFD